MTTEPLVVAHRTCPNHAPENSLEGIARAAALGADAVEVDVRLTRDVRPILLHDRTLRRSTGNPAPVWALAQNDIRRLRLANEERVPTFGLALEALPPGLQMAVHVKVGRAIHPVLDEIRNQGAESRVWIWSEQRFGDPVHGRSPPRDRHGAAPSGLDSSRRARAAPRRRAAAAPAASAPTGAR